MTRPSVDFLRLVEYTGIPTTEEALAAELAKEVEANGSLINNDSRMSPFWRLQRALVLKPALWLLRSLLVNHVLPNSFTATAKEHYLDLKAWDVDLIRKPATQARGKVAFTKVSSLDEVIVPAETLISTERINGITYQLRTLEHVTIPAGTDVGLVVCEALEPGTAFNLPAGYFNILPQSLPGINQVTTPEDWLIQPGADIEDDDALALRIQNQFSAVGRYHIDAVYRGMLAAVAGIRADHIFFEHEAPRGPGTANAYILMEVGPTPQALLDKLNNHVNTDGNHGHGDDLQCFALPYTEHPLVVDIWPDPFLGPEERTQLQLSVETIIRAAFRETADYAEVTRVNPFSRFSFSRLTQQLHERLPQLDNLEFNLSSIVSGQSLPRLSSLTVNRHD